MILPPWDSAAFEQFAACVRGTLSVPNVTSALAFFRVAVRTDQKRVGGDVVQEIRLVFSVNRTDGMPSTPRGDEVAQNFLLRSAVRLAETRKSKSTSRTCRPAPV